MSHTASDFVSDAYESLIDGEYVTAAEGGEIPIIDPNTEAEIATVPRGTSADIETVIEAAKGA